MWPGLPGRSTFSRSNEVSTAKATVAFIEDQLSDLPIRTAAMFGEYGIYCDNKIVGLICDDSLFIKPSAVDAALLEGTELAPPYPGAKNYHFVPGDLLDNRDWLRAAISGTADAIPVPAPKKPKSRGAGGGGV
jgi:TfoX/Sxy family transcriptional regulator of competence genes